MRIPLAQPENALSRAVAERRARGLPLFDLTESNPTQAGLLHEPALLQALADPRGLSYLPQASGLASARAAVAAYYAESRGALVDPAQIVLLASTSEAYALLFKLLCDPGEAVLVPEPSYPLFDSLAALEGVRAARYPLRWDGEWHVDLAALRQAFAAERPRAILVVSPGNPTGAFLKRDERAALALLCSEHGSALICDEVFADSARAPDPLRVETVAAFDDVEAFALSGLSKVCGLPQLKLGWCVASGPRAAERVAQLELIADNYLSVGTPVQLALPDLLEARHSFQLRLRARLRRNLAALLAVRKGPAPWDILPAEGGWSVILSVPRIRTEEEWALLLVEQGVLVHPGYFFDFAQGAYLVVSLLPEEADFAQAARLLAQQLG